MTDVDAVLASLALTGYAARKCRCGVVVEPRFAARDEQLEMSGGPNNGRVPTVVWDCPGCGDARKVPHEGRAP